MLYLENREKKEGEGHKKVVGFGSLHIQVFKNIT